MKSDDCKHLKCFNRLCQGNDRCPVRDYNLARIKMACIKYMEQKEKKKPVAGKAIHVHPPILFPPSGYIGMRQVRYNFEGLTPEQAIEIMSNGDCGET